MAIALTLQKLSAYQRTWQSQTLTHATYDPQEEAIIRQWFVDFTERPQPWFDRTNPYGHFTASALVSNRTMTKVLLTHHRKLNMWLQLGGHADGNHRLHAVARDEVQEESGLSSSEFLTYEHLFGLDDLDFPLPFDLDRHLIPARPTEPEHYHYDVRYLMLTDELPPQISEESHDVRWLTLGEARALTQERSMHRQFDKLDALRTRLEL